MVNSAVIFGGSAYTIGQHSISHVDKAGDVCTFNINLGTAPGG